jgi:menaquinone-dependent protoporphyrinogen oxidase
MKVLIAVASRHGSTVELATRIERVLNEAGMATVVATPELITDQAGYDAVILGSAVYNGRWLASAKDFVSRNLSGLIERAVWIFSSGPIGESGRPNEVSHDASQVQDAIGARDSRVFAGRLDRHDLGLGERIVVSVARARAGDYRSWAEIDGWARSIAATLQAEALERLRLTRSAGQGHLVQAGRRVGAETETYGDGLRE